MSKIQNRLHELCLRGLHRYLIGARRLRTVVHPSGKYKYQVRYAGIGKNLLLNGCELELAQRTYLQGMMVDAGATIFIDIGANIGAYSIPIAALGFAKKVYAIEGSKGTFDSLCRNVALNELQAVIEPMHAIVSSEEASVEWHEHVSGDGCGSGLDSIKVKDYHSSKNFVTTNVQTVPLDSLISVRDTDIAVKIDVEGHELAVLNGAKALLAQNRVVLQLEVWPENAENLNWLRTNGFRIIHRIQDDFFCRNY